MGLKQTVAVILVALGLGVAVGAWHWPAGLTVAGISLAALSCLLLIDVEE